GLGVRGGWQAHQGAVMLMQWNEAANAEIAYPGYMLQRGAIGLMVKRLQEHLTLAGFATQIDGALPHGGFGPATERSVQQFQIALGLDGTGIVDEPTWHLLVEPLADAFALMGPLGTLPPGDQSFDLPEAYKRVMQWHLAHHPRE